MNNLIILFIAVFPHVFPAPAPEAVQIREVIAIPDFSYDGTLWRDYLGGAAADALISRLRMDGTFVIPNRESVNEVLKEFGVEQAYDAELRRSALAFQRIRAIYAIAGRVTSIRQIQEVPGRVTVQITVDAQFIDPYTPFIITSERVEVEVRLKEVIPDDAEWDNKTASKLLRPAVSRLRQRFASMVRTRQPLRP